CSEPSHNAKAKLVTKSDQPTTSTNTSLPNEATQLSSNKRPSLFSQQRQTMVSCRDYCQGRMLLEKEPQSDLKPKKLNPSLLDLQMKQPTNIGMFYGLSYSRN
ncbi:hypothetical protein, partial [Vibrio sp. RE86]|uniref:hypothetical protein n=1 Tax=Vibrio sp. RE86 TaxID=2607605 RepID=UPI001C10B908